MSVVLVTGSAGLIGAEVGALFRRPRASTSSASTTTCAGSSSATRRAPRGAGSVSKSRSRPTATSMATSATRALLDAVFARYGSAIAAVIHTAAQPSHDWAASDPQTDFTVNANGTLEPARGDAPALPARPPSSSPAPTRSTATRPTCLPLVEQELRWEVSPEHPFADARHRREHERRLVPAQPVRRLQARRRCGGAGIRPLFRHAHRLLPRRLPDRSRPFRRQTARLSRLSRQMRGHRRPLYGLRLQGKAGPRQHPLLRSRQRVLAFRPARRARARSTTSAAAATPIARCSRRSPPASG